MKTVIGLFDSFIEAQAVVRDLESSGFGKSQISVVAQQDAVSGNREGAATESGAAIGAGLGILAGLAAVTVPGLGIIAALGPIIAGGILGAVAGGLVGSLVDSGVPEEHARAYAEGVRRGGTLVIVQAADSDEPRAVEIMRRHRAVDINERVELWQSAGAAATGFEASVSPAPVRPPQVERALATETPDPTGQTTMGDEVGAPTPPVTPMSAIPAPSAQPTRDLPPGQDRDVELNAPEPDLRGSHTRQPT